MTLTAKQQVAFDLIKAGKTIFITGPGGCGKTYLIRHVKDQLDIASPTTDTNTNSNNNSNSDGNSNTSNKITDTVAITALTGIAACLIGGQTLHSWAGMSGNDKTSKEAMLAMIMRNPEAVARWTQTRILIIDEVSMLSVELLNRLNFYGQQIRENTKFFGGLQVVFSGDFCQLPPVGVVDRFCFESSIWTDNVKDIVYLNEIMRQKDPKLQKILNEIRIGILTQETKQLLNSRLIGPANPLPDTSALTAIKPTILYPYNKNVDEINEQALLSLISDHKVLPYCYSSKDSFKDWKNVDRKLKPSEIKEINVLLDNGCPGPRQMTYCIGAQVMLIANLDFDRGLVNGARGVVTAFSPIKRRKAKAPDETVDVNTSETVTNTDGGAANKSNEPEISAHFDFAPTVRFKTDSSNYVDMTIMPYTWQLDHPKYTITRQQFPLIHAWAISIHKAQGQSCSLVITDLKNVFTPGQAYVALSRIQTLEGLFLEGIAYSKITCHPKIKKFYSSLNL